LESLINLFFLLVMMRFIEGFFGLLAIGIGMIAAAFGIVMHWLFQAAMLVGAAAIIALDVFALLVWLVNWRYFPEQG
jgi:hypothetical protein